ncbi:MAG: DUF2490 domain-containing protein [Prevotella sp.]|nr:DUF2490 domain-containing protein [Prevotella sp.]
MQVYRPASGKFLCPFGSKRQADLLYIVVLLFTVCSLFTPLTASAQSDGDDFGLDFQLEAEKKLTKKWSLSLGAELRTRDNTKEVDRWSVGVGADYKVTKWLKASAGYDLLIDNREKSTYKKNGELNKIAEFWGVRHRVNVALTASQKLGDFKVSLRERWQYTYRPEKTIDRYDVDDEDYESKTYSGKAKHLLRSRLQVGYSVPGTKLSPYANVELFNGWSLVKTRYIIGTDYDLSKKHSFGLFYRYQAVHNDTDNEESDVHLIGFSYKFKF